MLPQSLESLARVNMLINQAKCLDGIVMGGAAEGRQGEGLANALASLLSWRAGRGSRCRCHAL